MRWCYSRYSEIYYDDLYNDLYYYLIVKKEWHVLKSSCGSWYKMKICSMVYFII